MKEMERLGHELEKALLSLDRIAARRIVSATRGGMEPALIVESLIVPTLDRIGTGWEEGRVALSQVYMSGRICEEIVDEILPAADPRRKAHPNIAIACLEDHHRLGKRIVYSVLRAGGFELRDYGHGVEAERLVMQVAEDGVRILLISVLMLRSALRVRDVRTGIDAISPGVRIVVGGAPFLFDNQLWTRVGADAMGKSASDAIAIVTRLAGEIT